MILDYVFFSDFSQGLIRHFRPEIERRMKEFNEKEAVAAKA